MEMKIDALAGTLESSDVMVRIGPAAQPGIQLEIDSIVKQQFGAAIEQVVRETLAQLGVKRHIAVTVPEFGLASYLVADSDLVFTSSSHYGQHYADLLGLLSVDAPAELEPMRFYLLWHDCAQLDPASVWLRQQIAWVAGELGGFRAP